MKKYNSGDEFLSSLGNEKTTVLFYMSVCPFCKKGCPEFESRFKNEENYATVALDTDEDSLWDMYSIFVVPTVLVFENKKVIKRYDGTPGKGLNIEEIL